MADDKEAAAAAETAAPEVAGKGGGASNKIVMIVSIVNMLAAIGIIVVLFLAFQKEKSKATVEDVVAGHEKGHGAQGGGGHGGGGHGGGHGEAKGGHGESKDGHGGAAEVTDTGKIITLDPFTINLSSAIGTHPRYIRINVSIELDQSTTNEKEIEIKMPRIRDTIISLINSKKPVDFNTLEGRTQVKDEIKRTVNGYMTLAKVKEVYITNFAISQ